MAYIELTKLGDLPPGVDVDQVIAEGDERELAAVWNTHHGRAIHQRAVKAGSADSGMLAETAPVTALHALAANRRLVELLTGRRWYVMQAAREDGATWSEIGAALGMSKQGAQDWYRRKIEDQERHLGDLHDAARARAALEEDQAVPGVCDGCGGDEEPTVYRGENGRKLCASCWETEYFEQEA